MRVLATSVLMAVAASRSASASMVFIKNMCDHQIDLYDNHATVPIAPSGTLTRELPIGFKGMFRHGWNPQATLAEFTIDHLGAWFDISIIPTGPKSGPDWCNTLQNCRDHTGGVGYNVQMQIAPRSNFNERCVAVTCMFDGCPEAYHFPKDDKNTHHCPTATDFDLTFCPGGNGGQTPAPTTPAPTVESRSMDDLLKSGLSDGSSSGSTNGTEEAALLEPTTDAPVEITTTEGPAVEANTQSEAGGTSATGTFFIVIGAVAVVAGVVMVVVIRRKKAALDAFVTKDSIALTTPSNVL